MRSKWIAVTVGAFVVCATPAIAANRETALRSGPSTPTPARTTPMPGQHLVVPATPGTRPTVARPGIKWTTRGVRYAVWIW